MDHGANELQRGGSGNLLQKIPICQVKHRHATLCSSTYMQTLRVRNVCSTKGGMHQNEETREKNMAEENWAQNTE
jgi:hypothetical protein